MSLYSGERQVAETLDGIRVDHTARYAFVSEREKGARIIDTACGIGYGSRMMMDAGNIVYGLDVDAEALEYGKKHYTGPTFMECDLSTELEVKDFDVAVSFETIEHLKDPLPLLKSLTSCKRLYVSVPNQEVFPWHAGCKYHYRHYTPDEFTFLLKQAGWRVKELFAQPAQDTGEINPGTKGRTIIAVCDPLEVEYTPVKLKQETEKERKKRPVPDTVAILGLGPSLDVFTDACKRAGGTKVLTDEVWGINAVGDIIKCDRIFHMDDVRIQEIRAEAKPESNIANMLTWLKEHPGPIYTSRPHGDYPGLVGYPIDAVLNELKRVYFNSTAAWAVAYAIFIGVKRIILFGCDFTYPNAHSAERGRGCVEFWLGVAAQRGIAISLPQTTSLLDACYIEQDRLYGYDTVKVHIDEDSTGYNIQYEEIEKDSLPTAEQIEANYDHSGPVTKV